MSGQGPIGGMERLEATVKEVTNWDGLSMVRTRLFFNIVDGRGGHAVDKLNFF